MMRDASVVYSTVYSDTEKKTIKALFHWSLLRELTCEFPAQRTINAENDSIWWRHHAVTFVIGLVPWFSRWGHLRNLIITILKQSRKMWLNTSHNSDVTMTTMASQINCSRLFVQPIVVRRAGLLWSQQDFEWLWSVPLSSASLY